MALLGWAAAADSVVAQEVFVRALVDRSRIAQEDEVILSVEIAAPSFDQAAPPDVSPIQDFEILGGPSLSSRFQWINGRTSSTRTYSYALRPRKIGTLTIPALGLLIQGRTYHTEAVQVEVIAGGPQGSGPAGPGRLGPQRVPARPPSGGTRPAGGPGVQLRAEVDTRTAYVGQQITLRVLLDTQTEVLNLGLKEAPTFPGFWAEEIKLLENLDLKRVQRGNEVYSEYTLLKRALFPTSSGTLTIPAMTYQVQVRRRSPDPIESFFFTPTETLTRRTEPLVITVQPLPEASRPAGFSGAVGQFNLSVGADRKEARVNDAVGVKVKIAGEGNLNAVNALALPELGDFKQYAPKVSSSVAFQGDRLRSERVWDYVLIPLAPGDQAIPPVTFAYFDPRAGEYRRLSSPAIPIRVARGEETPGGPGIVVSQSDVRPLRQDIRYIKQAPGDLRDRSSFFYRSPGFAALVLLPIAADLGIFAYVRRRDRMHANARQRRERRARSQARRRLRDARRRMSPAGARAFYAEVAQALTEYVADKFDVSAAGLTHERIEELLLARNAPPQVRAAFHRCLEACDYALFAPASSGEGEMQRTLVRAEETLAALERSIAA
jgi:hypothetical protein